MEHGNLIAVLEEFRNGRLGAEETLERLNLLGIGHLRDLALDLWRGSRTGFPEVVLGQGKTAEQIVQAVRRLAEENRTVLVTRIPPDAVEAVRPLGLPFHHNPHARTLTVRKPGDLRGLVTVVTAGTGDIPVAEEAAETLEAMGVAAERAYDLGVAGLHRILERAADLRRGDAVVVVAGMEGALPSVVAGLLDIPVIAVPTSVGYGANFHGLAPLLAMLNACAAGVSVVNIDNGFAAGYQAALVSRLRHRHA